MSAHEIAHERFHEPCKLLTSAISAHQRSWKTLMSIIMSAHELYRSWALMICIAHERSSSISTNERSWGMSNTAYEWLLAISLIRCVNVNSPRGTKGVVMCPNGFIINNEQIPLGHSHTKTFIEKLYLSLYHVLPPIHLLVVVYSSYQSYIPSLV